MSREQRDAISDAIRAVSVAVRTKDDALLRDMTAAFAEIRPQLSSGLASIRLELKAGQSCDTAEELASSQSEIAGLRRSLERIEDKLDRVLTRKPTRSHLRRCW